MSISAWGIVINDDKEVILVKQTFWGFPKWHCTPEENMETCAIRKVKEETGNHDIRIIRKLWAYGRKWPVTGEDKEIHLFLMHTTSSIINIQDTDISEAIWVHKDKVAPYLTLLEDKHFFENISNQL